MTYNHYLLNSGLDCRSINEIRKNISRIKGGKLLQYIDSEVIVNLIISDDVRTLNNPDQSGMHIASGPTIPQTINGNSLFHLTSQLSLWNQLSNSSKDYILRSRERQLTTFKKQHQNIQTIVVVNIRSFVDIFRKRLQRYFEFVYVNYEPMVTFVEEAQDIFLREFNSIALGKSSCVYIRIGEVTCKPHEDGIGGRCQHFVSCLMPRITDYESYYCFAFTTDGEDYLKNVSGAYINNYSLSRCLTKSLDIEKLISSYQSNVLLKAADGILHNILTGINLGDIYMMVKL